MSLITHVELMDLVRAGVIKNADPKNVNGASVDVRLGETMRVEYRQTNKVNLALGETVRMREVPLDKKGYWTLPPGGFALFETMETFDLPDDIAVEFKLRSSMARSGIDHALAGWCLLGDTEIPLLNGSAAKIEDLVGTEQWVYSLDAKGDIVPGKATNIKQTTVSDEIYVIELDSGEKIRCTGNHQLMTRSGKYIEAQHIRQGDTLMPFNRKHHNGYEYVHCPSLLARSNWKNARPRWQATHRLVYANMFGQVPKNYVVHHKDHNPLNNAPDNLIKLEAVDHFIQHNAARNKTEESRKRSSAHMTDLMRRSWADPGYAEHKKKHAKEYAAIANHKRWVVERDKNIKLNRKNAIKQGAHKNFSKWREENPEEAKRAFLRGMVSRTVAVLIEKNIAVTPENYVAHKRQNFPTLQTINDRFGSFESLLSEIDYSNHVVSSVTRLATTPTPVYDMTVEKYHNFAIGSGVFVHNCDPGWHNSTLTMELRNNLGYTRLLLTPGMRIGQLVFWRGDPVPGVASYRTRGRYNNQSGAQGSKGHGDD